MVFDDDITPTESGPPPSPAELAYRVLEAALRKVADGFAARREVYRGLSPADRDRALSLDASHIRDVKHLAAETEQLLQALVGYRSDRQIQVVTERSFFMSNIRKICLALGASCLATAGVAQFATHWPTVALATVLAGTALTALATNLPEPPKAP